MRSNVSSSYNRKDHSDNSLRGFGIVTLATSLNFLASLIWLASFTPLVFFAPLAFFALFAPFASRTYLTLSATSSLHAL